MYTATSVATGPTQGSKMRRLDRDVRGEENVCLLSHRTVPNEAGDHRAARTPPWQRAVHVHNHEFSSAVSSESRARVRGLAWSRTEYRIFNRHTHNTQYTRYSISNIAQ